MTPPPPEDDMPPEAMSSPTKQVDINPSFEPELMKAVRSQDVCQVHLLLLAAEMKKPEESAELEGFKANCKLRALDYAAQLGHKEIIILLQLYSILFSGTPLWWAIDGTRNNGRIEDECVDVSTLLLDFGYDPNSPEPHRGESPMHLAAKLNLKKAMETLLAKANPPSIRNLASVNLKDQNGLSPLYHAVKEGHGAMAKLLIDRGANVRGETGPDQKSLMHYAAIHGDRVMLQLLYKNGSDIEAFDIGGKNSLYYAVKGGSKEVLETLLEIGADIDRKCPQSQGGRTTLHWMAIEGNEATIHILLENGASLDGGGGMTPVHVAASEGHVGTVRILLGKGAEANAKGHMGWTPLHLAAM